MPEAVEAPITQPCPVERLAIEWRALAEALDRVDTEIGRTVPKQQLELGLQQQALLDRQRGIEEEASWLTPLSPQGCLFLLALTYCRLNIEGALDEDDHAPERRMMWQLRHWLTGLCGDASVLDPTRLMVVSRDPAAVLQRALSA